MAKFPDGELNALRAHFFMPYGVTATHLTSVLVGAVAFSSGEGGPFMGDEESRDVEVGVVAESW